MSHPQESLRDPLKPWKHLLGVSAPTKLTSDAPANFIKYLLFICIISSVTIASHLFFSATTSGYFRCGGLETTTAVVNVSAADLRESRATNISHILFGIGGSLQTWNERRRYSEIWWKANVTRGFVWLDHAPPQNATWPETSPPYKVSADTSRFLYTCGYGSRNAIRIARIVKESFELGLDDVRWFVMGDDDTVFFTENLVGVLGRYDHTEMYYVGGISESVEQDVIHSYTMGYGGGGFAVSYPLAAELVRILDGCIDRYAYFYGSDEKIGGCMMELGVPITRELGFHQIDIRGSPYGLLAAHPLSPLVSLHHLDYVAPLFPQLNQIDSVKNLVKAYGSDPNRVLQQSFCYDRKWRWSFSVSWGYSVQIHPLQLTAKDMATPAQTFLTWRTWSPGPFTFNTRVNSRDPCQRTIIHYFDDVVKGADGAETLTSYVRGPVPVSEKPCKRRSYRRGLAIQKVNVSAPIMDSNTWKKAPRRQCCDVIHGGALDSVVHIRIRQCNQWESVTPPPIKRKSHYHVKKRLTM